MWTNEQVDALRVLADVYLQEDLPDQAVLVLEALQPERPEHAPVLAALCYAYLLVGREPDTLRLADQYLTLAESADLPTAPIWLLRSRAAWALGRADEALSCFARYQALAGHNDDSGSAEETEG